MRHILPYAGAKKPEINIPKTIAIKLITKFSLKNWITICLRRPPNTFLNPISFNRFPANEIEEFIKLNAAISKIKIAIIGGTTTPIGCKLRVCQFDQTSKSSADCFNVFVKKTSDISCEIKINCRFQQTLKFGDTVSTRTCVSTGNLEKEMFEIVSEKSTK